MSRPVTIVLGQLTGEVGSPQRNIESVYSSLRDELAEAERPLVILPELYTSGYTVDADVLDEVAEPVDGPSTKQFRAMAADNDATVAFGFAERGERGQLFNSVAVVDATGIVGHYRKLHLFGAEKKVFTPGDLGLPVIDTAAGRLGLCVCYDLRFPEVVRGLALSEAEIVVVPTAWVVGFERDRDPWDAEGWCPQARAAAVQANLSQVFMVCASQVGPGDGFEMLGSSIVADPYGHAVVGPLSGSAEETATVTIDLDAIEQALHRAEGIDPRADRRTDVYGLRLGDQIL